LPKHPTPVTPELVIRAANVGSAVWRIGLTIPALRSGALITVDPHKFASRRFCDFFFR
jgi:hypothetical protein